MLKNRFLALVLVAAGANAYGSECSGCHAAEDFDGLTLEEVMAALKDAGIPPHRKFAARSEMEVREAIGRPVPGAAADGDDQPE